MPISKTLLAFAILLAFPLSAARAQEPPAAPGPFKSVHLVKLTDAKVATLQAALADLNAATAKAGYPEAKYRLYKVSGKQSGDFNYLFESSWPSGEVYQKVHTDPDWLAVAKKHSEIDALRKGEIYNHYVEVPLTQK
ncbi:MAG: hypothetical protein ACM36C_10620 [Acidobacteriota bacterium]